MVASYTHDYARLINQVRTEVPGASEAMIRQQLFLVFKEFFRDSSAWQEEISLDVTSGTSTYEIVSLQTGSIERLWGVLDSNRVGRAAILSTSGDGTQLLLRDPPGGDETYTVTVVKNVGSPIDRDGNPEIPDWVLDEFGDYILSGVLSRLFLQPAKPYTDQNLAKFHRMMFRRGIGQARTATLHGKAQNMNTWAYPQSFKTNGQRGGIATTGTGFNTP